MATDPTRRAVDNLFRLQRLGNGLERKGRALLREMFDEIVGLLAKIDPTDPKAQRWRTHRLQKLLEAIGPLVRQDIDEWRKLIREDLAGIGAQQASHARALLVDSLGGAGAMGGMRISLGDPSGLGVNFFKHVIDTNPFGGDTLKEWADREAARTLVVMRRQLRLGMAQNEGIPELTRRIRDNVQGTTYRNAESIVRTAVNEVASTAHMETYSRNTDITTTYTYVATLDSRVSVVCANLDGQTFAYDGPDAKRPPQHFNCLAGDSRVLARFGVAGVSKRRFDGDVVVFRTASGRELTCTPNHPILTDEGWVPAGRLHVGGHVISDGGREWKTVSDVEGDHEQAPPLIEDVAESFLNSGGVSAVPVPTSAPDFHGDGVEGEVAVVGTDRLLLDRLKAAFHEHVAERALPLGSGGVVRLASGGAGAKLVERVLSASRGLMRRLSQLPNFLLAGAVHPCLLLLRTVPDVHAAFLQDSDDNAPRDTIALRHSTCPDSALVESYGILLGNIGTPVVDHTDPSLAEDARDHLVCDSKVGSNRGRGFAARVPGDHAVGVELYSRTPDSDSTRLQAASNGTDADIKLARQIWSGATGPVFLDDIVHVEVQPFSDHVFNLETGSGFYAANGIITHNCRSSIVPNVDWESLGIDPPEEGQRASADGPVAASTNYEQWLRDQPASVQNEVLGPTRAKLFREGEVTLDQMVRDDGGIVTLDELASAGPVPVESDWRREVREAGASSQGEADSFRADFFERHKGTEAEAWAKDVTTWADSDRKMQEVKADVTDFLRGGESERGRRLVQEVQRANPDAPELYRGVAFQGTKAQIGGRYSVGSVHEWGMSSFTSDKRVAGFYAQNGARSARAGTATVFRLESGGRAVSIEALSELWEEREWYTAGRFEVVEVNDFGQIVEIVVRHIAPSWGE